jgi:Holliday junction resolvase RusA-like endonuclease
MVQVRGTPRGRATARPGHVSRAVDPKILLWRDAIRRAAAEAVQNAGGREAVAAVLKAPGVAVDFVFWFEARYVQRCGKPHTAKPDGDNLAKLAMDALVFAGLLGGDDARASTITVRKQWAMRGGMVALVRPIAEEPAQRAPTAPAGDAPGWLMG